MGYLNLKARLDAVDGSTRYLTVPITDESSDIALGISQARVRVPFDATLLSIAAECSGAPTGNPIILDCNADGATVMTTYKLVIDIGALSTDASVGTPTLTTTFVPAGTWLTFDVDEIGTGVRGSGVFVTIELSRVVS